MLPARLQVMFDLVQEHPRQVYRVDGLGPLVIVPAAFEAGPAWQVSPKLAQARIDADFKLSYVAVDVHYLRSDST